MSLGSRAAERVVIWQDTNGESMPVERLSPRESEIMGLICAFYGNQEIADLLCISERTVRSHISKIYLKLGVRNRWQAARVARQLAEGTS